MHHVQRFGDLDEAVPDEVLGNPSAARDGVLQVPAAAVLEPFDQHVGLAPDRLEPETHQVHDPGAGGEDALEDGRFQRAVFAHFVVVDPFFDGEFAVASLH